MASDPEPSPQGAAPHASEMAAEKPFFFLHIRKTAGVSLRGLLANRFPADRILFQAHSVSGPRQPNDALFATGHVGFDYARQFKAAPTIFTVLREPMARSMSAYDFFQSHSETFLRHLATELTEEEYQGRSRFQQRARELGPARFLAEEEKLARHWLANVQTRQLAGAAFADCPDDDPQLLDAALQNLAEVDLAGILERERDTLHLLGRIMGWGALGPLPHLNSTHGRRSELDAGCRHILQSWNELDLRLYVEACRLFDQKLRALPDEADTTAIATSLIGGRFTPDQPVHGHGWHEREYFADRWLCWNSAPLATLNLRVRTARPSRFKCLLSHVFSTHTLDRLGIALNGHRLDLRKRAVSDGILIEGDIAATAWTADAHRAALTFDCPVLGSPRDLDPASLDARQLGFALAWLELV
ncbi:hypothetical protein [Bradyrhizobium sp. 199]|uniref:hypothetical protein n=1 Tax=Bradyrhizobium sp. 199 TaxID=2782664 RepID=UPI001FFA013C|nr:hypothetical protein [Bradyrhizobium sp. 199]